MPRFASLAFAAVTAVLGAEPASATGGLDCGIDDANVRATVAALFSYDANSPLFDVKGEIAPAVKGLPKELSPMAAGDKTLIQQWFVGNDLRLQFYGEHTADTFSSIKLTISTTMVADDETSYVGTYEMKVQNGLTAAGEANIIATTGTVSCSAG